MSAAQNREDEAASQMNLSWRVKSLKENEGDKAVMPSENG
jgi:hypothetical protein